MVSVSDQADCSGVSKGAVCLVRIPYSHRLCEAVVSEVSGFCLKVQAIPDDPLFESGWYETTQFEDTMLVEILRHEGTAQ